MKTSVPFIMRDQHRMNIDDIMQYDLTWRQKTTNRSLHMSIVFGLAVVSLVSQLL